MSHTFDRHHPFFATVKERYCLNNSGSDEETLHVVVDLKGSNISYNPGDSFGVIPSNDPMVVERTLQALRSTGQEIVLDKKTEQLLTLKKALHTRYNISRVTRPIAQFIHDKLPDGQTKEAVAQVLQSHEFSHIMAQYELWDFLLTYPQAEFEVGELTSLLGPLLPRFYSAASAQEFVGDEVHLTVGMVIYISGGQRRYGVASQFLGEQLPLHLPQLPLYVQPAHSFGVPQDPKASLIMVGAGTGIAPYRAFMQYRTRMGHTGKNWLFFGERRRHCDFLYEDYWNILQKQGLLKMETAFSRDQESKVYVQHKMLEQSCEIWRWLQDGAYFYVCGDAHHMAKDVDAALLHIVQQEGALSLEQSRAYLKELKQSKRYLRDVY